MFQASEGALLIKSPIFKQMLFPVYSCKFYSRVPTVFYQRAYCCHPAELGWLCWGGTGAMQCPAGSTGWMLQPSAATYSTDMHPDSFNKCHAITNSVFEKSTDSKLYLKLPYFASRLFYSISGIACLLFILLFTWRCNNSTTVTPLSSYANIFMSVYSKILF